MDHAKLLLFVVNEVQWRIQPGKKWSVTELLIPLFSIKPHFVIRLKIDRWILQCFQSVILAKLCRYTIYQQYMLIKAATLLFCS